MIKMTLMQAATMMQQPLSLLTPAHQHTEFTGISIDTRTLIPGNLFVAVKGERVDGHDFLDHAYQQGAAAALVEHPVTTTAPIPQLSVSDTTLALGQLSTAWRQQFQLPLVAVTGSNGKTTLKNMIAAIFTAACHNNSQHVLANKGNLNNQWGLPLTLAQLHAQHRYAVLEMGMNHFGEIAYLTKLAQPTVAVISNAAAAHLEGVGDVAGVARAKSEIFMGLSSEGVAILNRDDAFFTFWLQEIQQRSYLTFGFHEDADVRTEWHSNRDALQPIHVHTPKGSLLVQLPLLGKHNILNALAACATAFAVGVDLAAIKAGLEQTKPAPGRLQLHTLANGVKVIDDTYNANPFSLQAAVETLTTFAGKKVLVLGDMKELGTHAASLHLAAGESIRAAGIDYLFTYGELSEKTALAFGEGAYHFNEQKKLVEAIKPLLYNQTTILVKGSRSMKMEKVIAELIA